MIKSQAEKIHLTHLVTDIGMHDLIDRPAVDVFPLFPFAEGTLPLDGPSQLP